MTYISPFVNNFNIPNIGFRAKQTGVFVGNNTRADSFATNPLYQDLNNRTVIENLAKSSPEIRQILKENKIPLNINMKEMNKLQQGHLRDTRVLSAKMYSALPQELKQQVNLSDLQEAAMLHDFGKVLIPDNILNKKGQLSTEEKEIMKLHSELGYELLKQKGIKPEVLNLVKYHHQTLKGDGYPTVTNDYQHDVSAQILNVADKYSALRETRSYKPAMTKEEALNIIREDVEKGLISEDVFNALIKSCD